jgi:hypothetical protein
MAHAVPRLAEPEPEATARALQEHVVVGVAEVGLEDVVIDVLRRQLRVGVIEVHRLELEHDDRAGGVLGEGLVDPDRDLGTWGQVAVDAVVGDELLRNVSTHGPRRILADRLGRGTTVTGFPRSRRRVRSGQL